jgi:hypothetical protein
MWLQLIARTKIQLNKLSQIRILVNFSESSTKNSSDAEVDLKVSDTSKSINVTDHHDHLPTCTNVVVLASEQQLNEPIFRAHELKQKYYWCRFLPIPLFV